MSKPVHYAPAGQRAFCRQEGKAAPIDHLTEKEKGVFMLREARHCSTDLRKVTCPICLWEMASCMVRKGAPVRVLNADCPYGPFIKGRKQA